VKENSNHEISIDIVGYTEYMELNGYEQYLLSALHHRHGQR
jgi:hypothetical protein